MKKILILPALFFFTHLSAQRKLFHSFEIAPYLYADHVHLKANEWKNFFRPGRSPFSQHIDSMKYDYNERHNFDLKNGAGIHVLFQRKLPVFKETSRAGLEWSTGLGLYSFNMKGDRLSNHNYFVDTNRTYLLEAEEFQLRQHYISLYNALNGAVYSKHVPWLSFYAGVGIQASYSVSSVLRESFKSVLYQWSGSWTSGQPTLIQKSVPARGALIYNLNIPFGWGIDFSKNFQLRGGFEYFLAYRIPRFTKRNYSEGGKIAFSFRYKL